ncbi:MAG TPA: dienelactone hydrolase family protein, partial [Gemmataceae bacterium]|nr:dienelactone hydrolase family protein [Gemmataceae bacterium]
MRRKQGTFGTASLTSRALCLGVLVTGLVLVFQPGARAADGIKKSTDTFNVDGKTIEVERFEPEAPGTYPAVIMLHGSGGLKQSGLLYRGGALTVAREGFVALLVHYFDRTGITEIDVKEIKKEQLVAWIDTVRAAHAFAARLPGVDKKRIALVGFSLGACLALAVAGQDDLPIAAVVDWFGCLPEKLRKTCKRLPPTLVIHSEADKTVPVAEAHAIKALLQEKKSVHEIAIYKNQEHLFLKDLLGKDFQDAKKRTLAFLATHLKGEETAGVTP